MIPYKDLIVWQKSIDLALKSYKLSGKLPDSERFGLQSQIRRASISLASNIAEGSRRGTKKDFLSFLRIAHGSGAELDTQFLIARELGYVSGKDYNEIEQLLTEIMKMLTALSKKLL